MENIGDCVYVCCAMGEMVWGNIGDGGYVYRLDKDRDRDSFLGLVLVAVELARLMLDVVMHGGPSHLVSNEGSCCCIGAGLALNVGVHGGPSHLVNNEGSCCCVGEGCFCCCCIGEGLQLGDSVILVVVSFHRIGDGVVVSYGGLLPLIVSRCCGSPSARCISRLLSPQLDFVISTLFHLIGEGVGVMQGGPSHLVIIEGSLLLCGGVVGNSSLVPLRDVACCCSLVPPVVVGDSSFDPLRGVALNSFLVPLRSVAIDSILVPFRIAGDSSFDPLRNIVVASPIVPLWVAIGVVVCRPPAVGTQCSGWYGLPVGVRSVLYREV